MTQEERSTTIYLVQQWASAAMRLEDASKDRPKDDLMVYYLTGEKEAWYDLQEIFIRETLPWTDARHLIDTSRQSYDANATKDGIAPKMVKYWDGYLHALEIFEQQYSEQLKPNK